MFFYISRGQEKRGATWRGRVGCWAGRCSCTRAPTVAASRAARVTHHTSRLPLQFLAPKYKFDTSLSNVLKSNKQFWISNCVSWLWTWNFFLCFHKVANIFVKFSNWRVLGWCVQARGAIWKVRVRKRDEQRPPGRTPPPARSPTGPIRSSDEMWMEPVSHVTQLIS